MPCPMQPSLHAAQLSMAPTWQKMRMPVGLCIRSTAVSTLFTFWPPAPPARAVVNAMSCGAACDGRLVA